MSFNYPALQNLADGLIKQFGQAGTLKRGAVSRAVVMVEVNYSPRQRDGNLIQDTDRRFLISARNLATPPDSEMDQLVVGGVDHRIVTVSPLSPAGVPVYFETQVRR